MKDLSFRGVPSLAIAVDATTPTAPLGSLVWSTTVGKLLVWDGSKWAEAAFTNSSITGNAATATKLQTARTITIGNTGKSFDGSADVSWSLAEIGAAASGQIAASGLTQSAGRLLGRTSSGAGAVEEIGVGPGLVLDSSGLRVASGVALYDPIGLVQVSTGGGAGFYQRVDENFNNLVYDAAAFASHVTYRGIVEEIIDGQWMVRIPKFWFKAGTVPSGPNAGKAYWMISPVAKTGFTVHPAFIGAGGVEMGQIWVGKYQASSSGGKLQSVPGVLPRVNMDFPTARAEAFARNTGGVTGFRLWSYYDIAAIQMLASIEMGGLDMQSLIGQGRVSQSSAANVDAADVAQATWRGIVGLWGNVWQMVDGIKRNGGNWWRWQYNVPGNTTTSDFATGYVNTGRAALTFSGYPVTFDTTLLSAGIIVPATVDGAASNGSTGDYFWSNTITDDRIAYHGGGWADGAGAGLFYLVVNGAPSDVGGYVGPRLAKV